MPESYSVIARLSAKDTNFTSTMKNAHRATDVIEKKMKGGLGFGIMAGIGQSVFGAVVNGVRGMAGELDESSKAWQTFEGNMKILGRSNKYTETAKKAMQNYAGATIYSASDMASTFAQLESVGTKNTTALVKGFGGLAAASENPKQAMKTLSQQATQMASKPTVAWQDFKLMLEQSPAGISAVAREMGLSTGELVRKVQDGTLATNDFFDAVTKVGNSDGFSKLATSYKTVGEAMDGLQENLANKLGPSFKVVSDLGIKSIEGLIGKIDKIDGEELAEKTSGFIKAAKPYWETFGTVVKTVGKGISKFGSFLGKHGESLSKLIPIVVGAAGAYKGFKVVSKVLGPVKGFTSAIGGLLNKNVGGLAFKLEEIADGTEKVGKKSKVSNKSLVATGKAFALMGAGILATAGGFALLAISSIKLAEAGPAAIGVMAGLTAGVVGFGFGITAMLKTLAPLSTQLTGVGVGLLAVGGAILLISAGMFVLSTAAIKLAEAGWPAVGALVALVGVIALLAIGAAMLGPALTAGAIGFVAFGVGLLLVSTAGLLASIALQNVAAVLPIVTTYGTSGAVAILALGGAMIVFGAGALVAGAGALVAGAGLIVLGAGALIAGAGMLLLAGSTKLVASSVKSIAKNAKTAASTLKTMQNSVKITGAGLDALGSKADSAMKSIKSSFKSLSKDAGHYGKEAGDNFSKQFKRGLESAPRTATTTVSKINSKLRSGRNGAYSAGSYISLGLSQGLRSQLGAITSAADAIVAQVDRVIRKKAEIHSPSKMTNRLGSFMGEGFVEGFSSWIKRIQGFANDYVNVASEAMTGSFIGEISDDYNYNQSSEFVIEVPVELDGREVARVTAPFVEGEIKRKEIRESRKRGRK